MKLKSSILIDRTILTAVLAALLVCVPVLANQNAPAAAAAQKGFATAQEAVDALIRAAETFDVPALLEILGPDGKDLVSSQDPVKDKNNSLAFAALAKDKKSVAPDPSNSKRMILTVGNRDWPWPVPMVKRSGKWYFDTKAGHDELVFRRIGTNELNAIQVLRGFVEAQKEYASKIHDDSGIHQYAQKLISTPGKQDGLYWENPDGTPGGPITKGVAKAMEEGYSLSKDSVYGGYYFHILKGQGPAAPNGELDYLIKGMMIGGFAAVAVPAEYRVTGVQTFIINNDGIVYQQDLGPDSINIAKKIERYNPDKTWKRTDDQWTEADF
jgi:hypothetical protein